MHFINEQFLLCFINTSLQKPRHKQETSRSIEIWPRHILLKNKPENVQP